MEKADRMYRTVQTNSRWMRLASGKWKWPCEWYKSATYMAQVVLREVIVVAVVQINHLIILHQGLVATVQNLKLHTPGISSSSGASGASSSHGTNGPPPTMHNNVANSQDPNVLHVKHMLLNIKQTQNPEEKKIKLAHLKKVLMALKAKKLAEMQGKPPPPEEHAEDNKNDNNDNGAKGPLGESCTQATWSN